MISSRRLKSVELAKDIAATASLMIKLEVGEDALKTQTNFIAFINELGFRTIQGKEFTKMSFRKMIERLPPDVREDILEDLNKGFYS